MLVGVLITGGIAFTRMDRERRSEIESLQAKVNASQDLAGKVQSESEILADDLADTQERLEEAAFALDEADTNVKRLRNDYNDLYDSYNRLRTLALALVGSNSTSYQSTYSPISCTSNTIGHYTYTSCY